MFGAAMCLAKTLVLLLKEGENGYWRTIDILCHIICVTLSTVTSLIVIVFQLKCEDDNKHMLCESYMPKAI